MNTDEQILQDAWYGRETTADSGINEEEQSDDAPEASEEVDETEEVQEDQSDEDGEDSEPEQPKEETQKKKGNSNFAKILAERNALRKQLKEQIDSKYDKESMQDIQKLIESESDRRIEEKLFFRDNPRALDFADEIKSVASEHNMDIETAYKFYINVLDPQTVAKSEAKKLGVTGIGRKVVTSKDEFSSDKMLEMDKLYKEQYIR